MAPVALCEQLLYNECHYLLYLTEAAWVVPLLSAADDLYMINSANNNNTNCCNSYNLQASLQWNLCDSMLEE